MLTAQVHVFCHSVFFTGPGHWIQSVLQTFWRRRQKKSWKLTIARTGNTYAGLSVDIGWHACPGDTSVQMLRRPQEFMSETGHEPESLPDKIIFASMLNDITNWESQKVQNKWQAEASEVATFAARFSPGYWCICGPGSEKTWKYNEERPSRQFADSEWSKLALMIEEKLVTSKHPVFKCSNMLQTGALLKRKTGGGGVGNHFRNEPDNHRLLVNMMLSSYQHCFSQWNWLWNKMFVRIQTSTLELNHEEAAALAHHRPHDCAVDERLPHHEQSIRSVGDHLLDCNPPVCAVGGWPRASWVIERAGAKNTWTNAARTRCWSFQRSGVFKNSGCRPILQNKTGMQCSWKKHYAVLQIIYQINNQDLRRILHDIKAYPGNDQHWCRCRRFRLRRSRSLHLCVDTEVSSSLYGTAWMRTSRGVARWARQSSDFAPDIEGTDCVFFFPKWRNRSRPGPARRPGSVHRETDCVSSWNRTAATTRPIAPRPPRFCQAGHRETDCFPVIINARARHTKTMWNSHWWQTLVCNELQRKKLARATDDLQSIHECKNQCQIASMLTALVHGRQSYRGYGKASEHGSKRHRRTARTVDGAVHTSHVIFVMQFTPRNWCALELHGSRWAKAQVSVCARHSIFMSSMMSVWSSVPCCFLVLSSSVFLSVFYLFSSTLYVHFDLLSFFHVDSAKGNTWEHQNWTRVRSHKQLRAR